jgi:hypothetical protein
VCKISYYNYNTYRLNVIKTVELPAELETTVIGCPAICFVFESVPEPVITPAVVDLAITATEAPLFDIVIFPAVVSIEDIKIPVIVQFNGTIGMTDTDVVPLVKTAHIDAFGCPLSEE